MIAPPYIDDDEPRDMQSPKYCEAEMELTRLKATFVGLILGIALTLVAGFIVVAAIDTYPG